VGVYFLSETAQIANHQRSLQRLDLPTLDPTSQNALSRPFYGVGAKQRQFLLAKDAQFANALDPGGSPATLTQLELVQVITRFLCTERLGARRDYNRKWLLRRCAA
jgi:hypothetical protein